MSGSDTEALIDELAAEARPVKPLAHPVVRAGGILVFFLAAGAALVWAFGDPDAPAAHHARAGDLVALEMAAMTATGVLAVIGAFFLAVPGYSRRWLLAPLPAFLLWVGLAGLGCWRDFARFGATAWEGGHGLDCMTFILAGGVLFGMPLLWRLSRSRPIDPLPVALLGGLGAAALSALLLVFFHPFAVTFADLAAHLVAVGIVVAVAGLARRRALAPA